MFSTAEPRRREFLLGSAATVATVALGRRLGASEADALPAFTLDYAPHFGLFARSAGDDPVAQLEFGHDQGFRSWEDNGMKGRPVGEQRRIADAMERLGMRMGVVSALRGVWNTVSFAGDDKAQRQRMVQAVRDTVDVARRVNATWLTVVPGMASPTLPADRQTANCIDLLRRCADVVEPHGLIMVLEPLNRLANHPGVYLHSSHQAYLACRGVNRPSCKILFDVYHQQISEGNLLNNLAAAWPEVAYVQFGDNPGRHEPGTGEINYSAICRRLAELDYRGVIGMEHDNSQGGREGEEATIRAYRAIDDGLSFGG